MNEVSCRVLDMFFTALKTKNVPLRRLLEGVPYEVEYLRNKKNRFDWDSFVRVFENADKIWTEEDFLEMGASFLQSPLIRPLSLVARTLFSAKDYYRWAYSPKTGAGVQLMSCVDPSCVEIADNVLRLSLKIHDGYRLPPRSFFVLSRGTLIEMSRLVGMRPAKVEMFLLSRGGQFLVTLQPHTGFFSKLRHVLQWPAAIRAAGRELKEANEILQERYQELETAHALLDRQTAALKTAHAINGLVQGGLELTSTLETVVTAMVDVGKFHGATLDVQARIAGKETRLKAKRGETPDDTKPTVIPLAIGDQSLGTMCLWETGKDLDGREELIN